jgi:cytochrome P450
VLISQANSIAFSLLELARHPEFQEELRAETSSYGNPTNEALENMPLLNAFVKVSIHSHAARIR